MNIALDWRICVGACILVIFISYFFTNGEIQKYIGLKPFETGSTYAMEFQEELDTGALYHGTKHTNNKEYDDFTQKDFRYYKEEKERQKERNQRKREERKREEEWKQRHFIKRDYDDVYEKQRGKGERVSGTKAFEPKTTKSSLSEKEDNDDNVLKAEDIIPWGQPNSSKGERLCAQIISNITGLRFIKVRLNKIKNPETGEPLEIDCFNPEKKIAIEYSGPQHYDWPNWTNCSYAEFRKQIARDECKRVRCHELGISLIEVPYTVKEEELHDYILDKLLAFGFKFEATEEADD